VALHEWETMILVRHSALTDSNISADVQ
jgi:hypothetical protein